MIKGKQNINKEGWEHGVRVENRENLHPESRQTSGKFNLTKAASVSYPFIFVTTYVQQNNTGRFLQLFKNLIRGKTKYSKKTFCWSDQFLLNQNHQEAARTSILSD